VTARALARIALLGALAAAPVAHARFEPRAADPLPNGRPRPAVTIGEPGQARDYYRIDRGPCPLTLDGPGTLRIFVRADVPPDYPTPDSLWVTLEGLVGFPAQRWALALRSTRLSRYPDARRGRPTAAERVAVIVPIGRHALSVSGTSDIGETVYAAFAYEPVARPEPEPETPEVTPPSEAAPPVKAPPASRPAKPKAAPRPRWDLSSNLALGMIYDDNILRLSAATIEDFRRNTNPKEWAITTYDDMIVDATLDAEIARPLLAGKPTALRLRYERWEYLRNGIKTNHEVELRLRQGLRSADYVEGVYLYAPPGYIKELSDRPPFVSNVEPRTYHHFMITKNQFTLTYRWRARPWLALRVIGGRVLRFYNRPFLENDLWEWNGRLAADVTTGRFTTTVHYAYADVAARGYDAVGETLETSDNGSDGSYEKDWYRLQLAYRPKRSPYAPAQQGGLGGGARRLASWVDRGLAGVRTASLTVQCDYQRQFYTSQLPLDIDALHVGRLDETRQIQIVWTSRPVAWRTISLEAGWRYTQRTARGAGSLVGEDPSEEKDYTGSRYWLGMTTPLH
jgi:hypothetical protein